MTGPPNADKPVESVASSGGVIFNDAGLVLILKRKLEKNWVLPKGRVEEGETLIETAVREIEEETGLANLEGWKEIGLVRYTFFWRPKDVNYNKTVHYFLMRAMGEPALSLEEDFSEYKWATEQEAKKLLRHDNDRLITRKGFDILKMESNQSENV